MSTRKIKLPDDDDDFVSTKAVTRILQQTIVKQFMAADDLVHNITTMSVLVKNRSGVTTRMSLDDDDGVAKVSNDDNFCDTKLSGIAFYVTTALQISVCLYGIIGNTVLLYKERNTLLWYGKRLLYLGVCFTNAMASLAHLLTAMLGLLESSESLDWYVDTLTFVADVSVLAVVFSIAALTFVNLYEIRRLRFRAAGGQGTGTSNILVIALLFSIWVLACVFCVFGFGAHDERSLVHLPYLINVLGHYGVVISLQVLIGLALYATRRHNKVLHTQFAVSQAQQSLKFRTLLKRVHKRTKIVVPLLAANVVLWVVLLTVDVVTDAIAEDEDHGSQSQCGSQNQIWEALLDVLSIAYCALYPVMITRKKRSVTEQLKIICTCRYEANNDVSGEPSMLFTVSNGSAHNDQQGVRRTIRQGEHWMAMQQQWNRVEVGYPRPHVRTKKTSASTV